MTEIGKVAIQLRRMVRAKAGLDCEWNKASQHEVPIPHLLASRLLESEGKIS